MIHHAHAVEVTSAKHATPPLREAGARRRGGLCLSAASAVRSIAFKRNPAGKFNLKPDALSRFRIFSFCERQGASRRFVATQTPAAIALPQQKK